MLTEKAGPWFALPAATEGAAEHLFFLKEKGKMTSCFSLRDF